MKYLSRAVRDELASILRQDATATTRFRDKHPKPPRGVSVPREVAQLRLNRIAILLDLLK